MPTRRRASARPTKCFSVANANSPESVAIADDYAEKRHVVNRLQVKCPDSALNRDNESIAEADYRRAIEAPVRSYLADHRGISFIVLTKGIPIRVVRDHDGGRPSVDSLLAAGSIIRRSQAAGRSRSAARGSLPAGLISIAIGTPTSRFRARSSAAISSPGLTATPKPTRKPWSPEPLAAEKGLSPLTEKSCSTCSRFSVSATKRLSRRGFARTSTFLANPPGTNSTPTCVRRTTFLQLAIFAMSWTSAKSSSGDPQKICSAISPGEAMTPSIPPRPINR